MSLSPLNISVLGLRVGKGKDSYGRILRSHYSNLFNDVNDLRCSLSGRLASAGIDTDSTAPIPYEGDDESVVWCLKTHNYLDKLFYKIESIIDDIAELNYYVEDTLQPEYSPEDYKTLSDHEAFYHSLVKALDKMWEVYQDIEPFVPSPCDGASADVASESSTIVDDASPVATEVAPASDNDTAPLPTVNVVTDVISDVATATPESVDIASCPTVDVASADKTTLASTDKTTLASTDKTTLASTDKTTLDSTDKTTLASTDNAAHASVSAVASGETVDVAPVAPTLAAKVPPTSVTTTAASLATTGINATPAVASDNDSTPLFSFSPISPIADPRGLDKKLHVYVGPTPSCSAHVG